MVKRCERLDLIDMSTFNKHSILIISLQTNQIDTNYCCNNFFSVSHTVVVLAGL